MCSKHEKLKYPDFSDCQLLWEKYGTPSHVIGHCIAVSETAVQIAEALNKKGYALNVPLLKSAGLLHDIARVEDNHWEIGADLALSLGHSDLAALIRVHMFYKIKPDTEKISETDLLCLADRTVKEDRFVGLEERMDYILKKSKDVPGAEERIHMSFDDMRVFVERLEKILDCPLATLMK